MRRALGLAAVLALALALPAAAGAKTTANFTFKSSGKAVQPGAVVGLGADGTYEDFPFTIAPDDEDGAVSVGITWGSPADDWDLYVYKKNSSGGMDQVASSAQGTTTEETAVIQAQGKVVEPGAYIIRVQNYASSNPDFDGVTKFTQYTPPNIAPKAVLKKPRRTAQGRKTTLDASGSTDSDGQIVNYRFDLDGDGSTETDNGSSPILKHAFLAGRHHVVVRVTDDKGGRAYATRTVRVYKKRKK